MRHTANVWVAEHSFAIVDQGQAAIEMPDWTTGLIGTMTIGATIHTGINYGYVRVTVEVLAERPKQVDAEPWDDIVEATITAQPGHLGVYSIESGPTDTPPDLPVLSQNGPGTYRLRAHVRGRDLRYDDFLDDAEAPTEDYLFSIWPAPPASPLIIRATDRCGYSMRLANLQTKQHAGPPSTPPYDTSGRKYDDRLTQARLDAAAQRPPLGDS